VSGGGAVIECGRKIYINGPRVSVDAAGRCAAIQRD